MRYEWYKIRWPKDRFLGTWGVYDLWRDDTDDIIAITWGNNDEDDMASIDVDAWEDLEDEGHSSEQNEALCIAKERWEKAEEDPSVSPHCRARKPPS